MNCEILKMVSLKKDFARKAREWKVVNDDKGSERCLVEQQMRLDDQTTAHQLHSLLVTMAFPCH